MNLDEKLEIRFYFKDLEDKLLLVISSNLPLISFTTVFKSRHDYSLPSIAESVGKGFADESEIPRLLKNIPNSLKNKGYVFGYSTLLPKDIDKELIIKDLCRWIDDFSIVKVKDFNCYSLLEFLFKDFIVKNKNFSTLSYSAYYHLYLPRKDNKDLYHTEKVDMSKKEYIETEKNIARYRLSKCREYLGHFNLAIYYDHILEL